MTQEAAQGGGRLRPRRARGRGARARPVVGLALVLVAVALLTVARPTTTRRAVLAASPASSAPLLVSAPGLLESRSGTVTATARGVRSGAHVVVAVGREDDVAGWASGAARTTLVRLSGSGFATATTTGTATVPDPATSDLWVRRARGTTAATLSWAPRAGRWLLLVAADGASPAPDRVELSWRQRRAPWWAWPLLAAGVALLLAGPARTRPRRGSRG